MNLALYFLVYLIGTISGLFLHNYWVKSEIKKKKKRIWCSNKDTCQNHICKNMPSECEYDIRDLL